MQNMSEMNLQTKNNETSDSTIVKNSPIAKNNAMVKFGSTAKDREVAQKAAKLQQNLSLQRSHHTHGGDIYRNQVRLDFSVNTNPLGMPQAVRTSVMLSMEDCAHYPDPDCQKLREAIAERRKAEPEQILCGNGASELFMAIVRAIEPRKALVTAPAFSGYEYALSAVNAEIAYAMLLEEDGYAVTEAFLKQIVPEQDVVFLCNPNNPTGSIIEKHLLKQIVKACQTCDAYLVVDQCFLEMTGRYEELCAESFLAQYDKIIIVNAFTKTYACAGLRLGYLMADARLCTRIQAQLSEWNVSVPAVAAGITACREQRYVEESVEVIARERGYLLEKLTGLGMTCYPSEANFLLLRTDIPLYDQLMEQGMLIRHCDNYHGLTEQHYRIAVKTHDENVQLVKALMKLQKEQCCDIESSKEMTAPIERDRSDGIRRTVNEKSHCIRAQIQEIPPLVIEEQSFETITEELGQLGIQPEEETAAILKRVIHTTADFEYVNTLTFSRGAVRSAKMALMQGATIITDTNMAAAGIHKKTLEKLGGRVVCFMADAEVAGIAKERGVTRASVSMEFASRLEGPCIFAIGNAPTALVQLYDMIQDHRIRPELIIGVPVGFVHVVASKKLIMETGIPYIINQGRKGGSNVAAAICNALLYQIDNER